MLNNHLNKIIYTLVDGPFKFVKLFAVRMNQGPHPPISWLKGVRYWEGELREERNIKAPDPLSVTELHSFKKNGLLKHHLKLSALRPREKGERKQIKENISQSVPMRAWSDPECWKMLVNKPRLVRLFDLYGWEGGEFFFRPITGWGKAKLTQTRNYFRFLSSVVVSL